MYGATYALLKLRDKRLSRLSSIPMKTIPKIAYKSEFLLDNYIDKDLQEVLKPLSLMQSLLICSKYSIRDNFITSNSFLYNFIGVFVFILYRSIGLYRMFISVTDWETFSMVFNWTSFYDFCSYSYGIILNYYNDIKWSDTNILLVLKLQHVLRALKITNKDLSIITFQNWVSVIAINCIIIGSISYMSFMFFPHINFIDMAYFYFSMTFDVSIVYAKFLIRVACISLRVWTEDARKAGNSKSESYWEHMIDVYLNILQIYKTVEKTLRKLVRFSVYAF